MLVWYCRTSRFYSRLTDDERGRNLSERQLGVKTFFSVKDILLLCSKTLTYFAAYQTFPWRENVILSSCFSVLLVRWLLLLR